LEISNELSKKELHKNETHLYLGRLQGSSLHHFRLPENAKINKVKENMKNGVLTLTIPKMSGREPHINTIATKFD
jgi:HSP20 family molecular chaperone IbpA